MDCWLLVTGLCQHAKDVWGNFSTYIQNNAYKHAMDGLRRVRYALREWDTTLRRAALMATGPKTALLYTWVCSEAYPCEPMGHDSRDACHWQCDGLGFVFGGGQHPVGRNAPPAKG